MLDQLIEEWCSTLVIAGVLPEIPKKPKMVEDLFIIHIIVSFIPRDKEIIYQKIISMLESCIEQHYSGIRSSYKNKPFNHISCNTE